MPTSDVWMSSSGLHKVSSSLLLFTVSVAADATWHYAFQHRSSWCCVCLHGVSATQWKSTEIILDFEIPPESTGNILDIIELLLRNQKQISFITVSTDFGFWLSVSKLFQSQSWWRLQIINWDVVRNLFWLCKSNLVIALFQPDETLYWFPNFSLNKVDSSSNVWC